MGDPDTDSAVSYVSHTMAESMTVLDFLLGRGGGQDEQKEDVATPAGHSSKQENGSTVGVRRATDTPSFRFVMMLHVTALLFFMCFHGPLLEWTKNADLSKVKQQLEDVCSETPLAEPCIVLTPPLAPSDETCSWAGERLADDDPPRGGWTLPAAPGASTVSQGLTDRCLRGLQVIPFCIMLALQMQNLYKARAERLQKAL